MAGNAELICDRAIYKLRCITNGVQVPPFSQMPGKRSYVAEFHHCFKAYILLNSCGKVVDRWYVRINLKRTYRHREQRCCVGEIVKIVDVAVKNLESTLLRRIVSQ